MKISGIGVDIAEIKRFRKLPYKSNQGFYKKIFTPAEIKYCLSKTDPYPHFTARFAAKEAVIKAGGLRLANVDDIEIFNDKTGQPYVKIKKRGTNILISLSHAKDYAIAFVIWLN